MNLGRFWRRRRTQPVLQTTTRRMIVPDDAEISSEIHEHPLVTKLIGDKIDQIPELDYYIGYPGRGIKGDEGPLSGLVRLYLRPNFEAYIEVDSAKVKAIAKIPGDLRYAIWVERDASVKLVSPVGDVTGSAYLSGSLARTTYAVDPCGQPTPPSAVFPTGAGAGGGGGLQTAAYRISGGGGLGFLGGVGGFEPTNCRICPSH
jgi:hypothetical protein